MEMNKRIVLVFRDPLRRGKSVEEIYKGLAIEFKLAYDVHLYYYSDQKSIFRNIRSIYSLKPDLIHITSDIYFIALFFHHVKLILTIHDIGRYRALRGIRRVLYKWIYFILPGVISNAIVVVSSFSRSELATIFPRSILNKVSVIHNPIPYNFKFQQKKELHPIPVILQVGTDEHKNLERIIQAITSLSCRLVIIGQLSDNQTALLNSAAIDFEYFTDLTYSQVLENYQNADIITFVSRYEGFGMPIIEAQAIGRPVITSNLTSLPEIAGDGAFFIKDIYSVSEIRQAILTLLENREFRMQLIARGSENVKRFSREAIAQKYIGLYKNVLE